MRRAEPDAPRIANIVSDYRRPESIQLFGGTDINLITGFETLPRVTQNESAAWSYGNTVVVTYKDSSGGGLSPQSFCGVSVSTDGGASFTRLAYKFNEGGACLGYPNIIYSVRAAKWFAGFLSTRCGTSGMGQWESPDGINWSNSGCLVTTAGADLLSTWVDNNPASPYYGRQYAFFNDFTINGGAPRVNFSTDDGVTWSPPVTLHSSLRRAVKITGSLGTDGTVFAQTMGEGGGGLNGPRQNFIYRSTDGGATWSTAIQQNTSTFLGPGRSVSGYFPGMYTTPQAGYWRGLGWCQPGVGPGGIVHCAYASRPGSPSADPGDIYYIRSTDNGSSWSIPLKLNTDATTRGQWQPALSVNVSGKVFVSWYDERSVGDDGLQYFGRASLDNGATWGADMPISDFIYPKPLQLDPGLVPNDVGLYNYAMFSNGGYGHTAYHTWTDGRVQFTSMPQQDVLLDKIVFNSQRMRFDFDGDGRSDVSVFRPSTGVWHLLRSQAGYTGVGFGQAGDRPVPADYDDDSRTDIAVFRGGTWYLQRSLLGFTSRGFGTGTDIPMPADFDGDGSAELGVFRPTNGTWYLQNLVSNQFTATAFGSGGDVPVAADYDGDGRADIAVFRPSTGVWHLQQSTAGYAGITFGQSGDRPVPADYDGDGRTDVAVFRPSNGVWYLQRSSLGFTFVSFGFGTDTPTAADYDGDGLADMAVFRASSGTWYLSQSTSGFTSVSFGAANDQPVPAAYVL